MPPPSTVEFEEEIDVRLLANLSQNFRSPYEAIFELVDNGLASRLPGRPVCITITGTGGVGGVLKVVAKGGKGIGRDELRPFVHWGRAAAEPGLNRFGQGGKAAIGYLGKGLRVRANRHDEDIAYQFEDRDWLVRPDGKKKRFVAQPVPPAVPGVGVVQTEILELRKIINLKKLSRELAWRYRPALREEKLQLRVGRQQIQAASLGAEQKHMFSHLLVVPSLEDPDKETPVQVQGWIGIAPPKHDGRGSVRCSAYGRVVLETEYFGHRNSSFKASLNSLVGEVDLSFVPMVLDKNAFDTGSRAWEAAQQAIHREMQPYMDRLLQRKETNEPTEEERLRAMEAKDMAHRALERLAAESTSRAAGSQLEGRKPPESPTSSGVDTDRRTTSEDHASHEPRTPPPPDAVGRLPRKGMSADWDVRALDPRIRSSTVDENGRREIVINNRFPTYKERKGDLLYMLETGLLEELKPGEHEDKTVAEYSDQANQALHLALTETA